MATSTTISIINHEKLRHTVTLVAGLVAHFRVEDHVEGQLLGPNDGPPPEWTTVWQPVGGSPGDLRIHTLLMTYTDNQSYRWRIHHIDGAGHSTLVRDEVFAAPIDFATHDVALV